MEGNSIISFENLCRIFEMRIKLDKEKGIKTTLDILDNYEKYSKKIDSIYNSEFQKELKPLISPAITLEKEEDRLRRLIKLLEERLDRRVELEDRFYASTGKYITGLQIIVSEDELEEKRERLSLISKYLETSREIEDVTDSINKLSDLLSEEDKKKEEYESKNKIMEDELYSSFMSVVKEDEFFRNINEDDINSELDAIRSRVAETKETLDITKDSVGSLISSGLEDDYASYIEEAEKSYYNYKNRELILKIYKLVIDFEDDFKLICSKREKISELLEEKKLLRDSLSIDTEDELFSFEKVLLVQKNTLDVEREVLENIANYTSRIKFKEERLEELNEANSSVEILAILKEYGLVETYDTEELDETEIPLVDEEEEEVLDSPLASEIEKFIIPSVEESIEPIVEEVYDPYRIVEVKDYPRTLNVGLARLKGESVREKVNKKLNPKVNEPIFDNLISNVLDNSDNIVSMETEVNNSNIVIDTPSEEVVSSPSIDIPVIEDMKVEVPVWSLPTEEKVTVTPQEEVSPLPIWENIKPIDNVPKPLEVAEEFDSFDIVSKPNVIEDNNLNFPDNNMFWTPVSESKLETNAFPNLNLPISGNDKFEFPSINN